MVSPHFAAIWRIKDSFFFPTREKQDRIAQIKKQKLAGTRSVPPSLLSAQMFDLGDTVMMIAHEQRRMANAFWNTRMWVKRDGRWQMLFSFNTRIE